MHLFLLAHVVAGGYLERYWPIPPVTNRQLLSTEDLDLRTAESSSRLGDIGQAAALLRTAARVPATVGAARIGQQ
ncbi:MAG TPA: hypothetical protein VFA63_14450 [Pseudonocardiaceae bacterium]|nr:hypothetical protein [Pseudonocardiaceae bacterium]